MTPAIAIVGLACRYPDAASPAELWDNVLAQRRAFRRIPPERLNAADYYSADPQAPDCTYAVTAALIEDYEFDRIRHRVSGSTYRSADLAHWLALDVAGQSLSDAGFPDGEGLPHDSTAVFLGNTLTGEFSRAAALRLRWPYVRRVVAAALGTHGGIAEESAALLRDIEAAYKSPFAEVGEETLAGGLSNTIAGRIANHLDLKGGGYTVDGACASSLLSVATACSALAAGDCDVALAGGVDLSLDPFELVGFAKAGALAPERMRIYDVNSAGFWPGEGCGFAVLMRHEDALAHARRVYALIRGWGISSDGSGGITRPEAAGQLLALNRAYRRAGFGPDTVAYFEGHGTGTAVGDATELRVIGRARAAANATAPAAIGSIKANIGHTKAAAGIAGLIKAAMAVHSQVVPPTTGCESPHPELAPALRAPSRPETWPAEIPLRAAVSAMGFGGINSHIVLEAAAASRRRSLTGREESLARTPQDAELFLFQSAQQVEETAVLAPGLSMAEMADLAASLPGPPGSSYGFALVASTPEELSRKVSTRLAAPAQLAGIPRIGFLFPGQGSQNTSAATEVAQPAIVRDSLDALDRLAALGIEASVAIGHSLGELTALCWAGAVDRESAIRIAAARGRFMASVDGPPGAMAGIAADAERTQRLIGGEPVVIAGINSPRQTVVSGAAADIGRLIARAREAGTPSALLPVSHAFHSPLVAAASEPLSRYLAGERFQPVAKRVISTVSGLEVRAGDDLREVLHRQVTAPVRFCEALERAREADLWIEVGPGRVLSGLAAETISTPVFPVECGTGSQRAFLEAVAAACQAGAPLRADALFEGRFTRPFRGRRRFFANPCELAPVLEKPAVTESAPQVNHRAPTSAETSASPVEVVRGLVAERAELPPSAVSDEARLLADLHLNSIAVAQIATEAARRLGIPPPTAPLEYAGLSITEMARALEAARANPRPPEPAAPPGVDAWVRPFLSRLAPRAIPRARAAQTPDGAAQWQFFGPTEGTPRSALEQNAVRLPPTGGVVLCLPSRPDERHIRILLDAARAAARLRHPARFVLVQHDGGAASLARTIHLEVRELPVCVVNLPEGDPHAVERVAAEAAAVRQYSEAHYDAAGERCEPVLSLLTPECHAFPLGGDDVLLVAGGGKGIGAECAMEAARLSGARLAILGTSVPDEPEVAANLDRMRNMGLRFDYLRADVTDLAAVRSACERIGPITAILHCAGVNRPRSIEALEDTDFRRTVAVKTEGLRSLLEAAGGPALKLVVAFGSIIARMGLPGEADYAVANEWMARDLAAWGREHPQSRCLTLEWSVWAGAGMGERVARLEELRRRGVSPISIEEGVRAFREALCYGPQAMDCLVMTGRFGAPPTIQFGASELPLLRFLERTRLHYPGVELITEADLSADTDPYLDDHVFSGARLLPGVMALEAMAQAAMAVTGSRQPPTFSGVRFARPVIVPSEGALTVRLAALTRGEGRVEVCLRSAETDFQTDHCRAVCRFADGPAESAIEFAGGTAPAPLDPARDLYGSLLFQRGRFHRLRNYRRLRATECVAEAAAEQPHGWFNRYLPQTLVLGDPGIRDAAIHAIQACIPHARVLPAGAGTIALRRPAAPGMHRIHAREQSRDSDVLFYDLEIATEQGEVVERWNGLELRIVGATTPPAAWPPALLAPYLERRVGEIAPRCGLSVELGTNGRLHGLVHRPDGKPLLNGRQVSRSHSGELTLTVSAPDAAGCDFEPVTPRAGAVWCDLLGPAGFALAELVAREAGEDIDAAATRVWCALECGKKAGLRRDAGMVLSTFDHQAAGDSGWVMLASGAARIATLVAPVAGFREPLAFALLVGA